MATTATHAVPRNGARDTRCRLCLKNIEITQTAGIDLLENQDINRLVLDVYRVEVLQTDEGPTKICVPCYILLVEHYKLRIRCLATRKNFRLNQVVLLTQINAFRALSGQEPLSQIGESSKEYVAAQEKATQTDASLSLAVGEGTTRNGSTAEVNAETTVAEGHSEAAVPTATILIDDESSDGSVVTIGSDSLPDRMNDFQKETTPSETVPPVTAKNGPIGTIPSKEIMAEITTVVRNVPTEVVSGAPADPSGHTAAAKNDAARMRIQHLLPVVVDCRKETQYLEALWPLKVSLDVNSPAPLEYMCSTCNKTFKHKDSLRQHRNRVECVPTCRYCKNVWSAEHNCPFLKKYSHLMAHIMGSDKYCSKYSPDSDALAENGAGLDQSVSEKAQNETVPNANDSMLNGTKSKSDQSASKRRRSSDASKRKKAKRNDRSRSRSRKSSIRLTSETRMLEEEIQDTTATEEATVYLSSSDEEPLLNISNNKRRRISSDESEL